MEVGLKIKSYLEENGISQTFVSKKTGIELPKLNLALNGNRRFTFPEYEMICWALGVNTDKFLHPRMPVKWTMSEQARCTSACAYDLGKGGA